FCRTFVSWLKKTGRLPRFTSACSLCAETTPANLRCWRSSKRHDWRFNVSRWPSITTLQDAAPGSTVVAPSAPTFHDHSRPCPPQPILLLSARDPLREDGHTRCAYGGRAPSRPDRQLPRPMPLLQRSARRDRYVSGMHAARSPALRVPDTQGNWLELLTQIAQCIADPPVHGPTQLVPGQSAAVLHH